MAKLDDVVVSDRLWKWTSQPGGVNVPVFGFSFRIVALGNGSATYEYPSGDKRRWSRPIANIAAHAEPEPLPALPRCEPGCTPARPCWTERACPVHNEPRSETMAAIDRDYQADETYRRCRRIEAREPIELRCGRELACGLFRTT